jgi:hypothetical protein
MPMTATALKSAAGIACMIFRPHGSERIADDTLYLANVMHCEYGKEVLKGCLGSVPS